MSITQRLSTSSRTGSPRLRVVLSDNLDGTAYKSLLEDFVIWLQSDNGKKALETAQEMAAGMPHGVALQGRELIRHVRDETFSRWLDDVCNRWQSIDARSHDADEQAATADSEDEKLKANRRVVIAGREKQLFLTQVGTCSVKINV